MEPLKDRTEDVSPDRKAMLNRLKRVEGQIRGIQRMIVEEKDCCDVLLQLSAARKAMQNTCIEIVKNYMSQCMVSKEEDGTVDVDRLQKLIEALVEIAPIKQGQEE
nr:metal-sensitive transcriptional regulator [uncultured Dethiosulfovibrio sp.]